jgi:hypothetical protein
MKRKTSKLLELSLLLAMAAAAFTAMGMIVAEAQKDPPPCAGLSCSKPNDCARECFCNNPSNSTGWCYAN